MWSIQVTRPILREGRFDGVIVVSLNPTQFAAFGEKIRIGPRSALTIVRSTGEVMARYPTPPSLDLGYVLHDRPFLEPNPQVSGNYRQRGSFDGVDRLWGCQSLPEYGMTFIMGEAMADVLSPFVKIRDLVLIGAIGATLLTAFLSCPCTDPSGAWRS